MSKTLRVRTAAGWVTKPLEDLDINRLTAEEVDDNFLALEDMYQPPSTITGDTVLLPTGPLDGWLDMDGSEYLGSNYPDLYALTAELGGAWIGENGAATGNLSYITGAIEGATDYTRALADDETYLYTGASILRVLTKDDWTQVFELDVDFNIYGLAVDANYVYIAHSSGNYFTVVDKTDWSVVAGTPVLDGTAVAITEDALYVYIANFGTTNRLLVVDKSDWSIVPGTPDISFVDYAGIANDANYVYLTHGEVPFLTVIQKSDWSIVPSQYVSQGAAVCLEVDAQYLYVGQNVNGGGLLIIDRATGQTVAGVASIGGEVTQIAMDATYIHVAWERATGDWGRYTAVRKSDWGEQIEINITNGARPAGMGIDNGRVILALESAPYFEAYNISDFTLVTGTPTLPGQAHDAVVHGGFTYIVHSGGNTFTVVDNANWNIVSGTPVPPDIPVGVAVDTTYVYVVYGASPGFTVYNKSDWSVVPGTPTLAGIGWDITVDVDYVYIGHGDSPFNTILNKADWSVVTFTDPLPGRMVDTSTDGTQVFFAHLQYPYITERGKPLFTAPGGLRVPAINDIPDAVEADGTYVYVAKSGSPGIVVIDPTDWSEVNTNFSLSGILRLAAGADFVYAARWTTDTLKVIDKATWTQVASPPENFAGADEIHTDGKYVYWSNGSSPYVHVYAIENENFKVPAVTSPVTNVGYKVKT